MSFLNGIFLFALPLAAAPVVVHLLRRRQRHVVLWGAMQFLTDAVAKGRRFDRLEEWLLLALRTAALLALVLALARPLVSSFSSQPAAETEMVLVIDDSLSTDQRVASGKAYDIIRDKARRFIEDRSANESVRIMMAAEGPRWIVDEPTYGTPSGKRQLLTALDETQPTRGAANFAGCLRLASSFESAEENVARRVVVFTDNQSKGWQAESRGVWDRLRAAVDQGKREVSFEVAPIDVPPIAAANLSLDRVTASRQVAAQDEQVVFSAKITNTGKTDCPGSSIAWLIDGKQQAQTDVPLLAAGQTGLVEWRSAFAKRGVHEVSAAIEFADPLQLDNQDEVIVEVVDSIPILVVAETTELDDAENTFLATALGYDESKDVNNASHWRSLYRPTFAKFADLEKETLGNYHAVVVNGLAELSVAAVEKLDAYVRDGGGLWLMLGPRIDREEFNRRWYRDGVGLCPMPLASLMRPTEQDGADASIHPPPANHPATAMLADTDRLDIDRVRLRRYHMFRRQSGQENTVLLETGRGAPLAMLHNVGKGRVIIQGFPLRTDWSDLAISKSFVVLVQDWLTYLTQPAATRFNIAAREPFIYQPTAGNDAEEAEITLPDGSKTAVKPIDRGGAAVYRCQTSLPGKYQLRLKADAERVVPFQVTRDAAESDLAVLQADDIAMLQKSAGIRFGESMAASVAVMHAPRPRLEPAWWPLLIAMICLMAAESLVATRVSRGRFGDVQATA
jgi:hypothetical protein